MQVAKRKTMRNGDLDGSVWENRVTKFDHGKNRIKGFNGDNAREEPGVRVYGRLRRNQSVGVAEKKKISRSEIVDVIKKNPIQQRKLRSSSLNLEVTDENSKEFGICKEKVVVLSSLSSVDSFCQGELGSGLIEHRSKKMVGENDEQENEDEEFEEEEKSFDVVEAKLPDGEPGKIAETNQLQIPEIPVSVPLEEQPPIVTDHPDPRAIDPDLTEPNSTPHTFQNFPETQNRLQGIVDMIMWRDISKSAFVFGLGSFLLLSSSFTKDLSFSLISAISYLGLLYLAIIFVYRSILCRGATDPDETTLGYTVVEADAIWFLKLILPYLNDLLSALRVLFSGDPSTTMKLSIVLFVLARCGSSITIWTMTKLAFFGVFTIPKVCSAYSVQLTAYAKFWVRRFKDAWNSCSHKKAAAVAVFTVIWNLSSIVARIWAVFFLVVVVRFYQQNFGDDEWADPQEGEVDPAQSEAQNSQTQAQRNGPTISLKDGPTLREVVKDNVGL